jgi:hypothetical protein
MQLVFDRGSRESPAGHALVYFRADDGGVLATYVTVPPIKFDLSKFVPKFLEGMDLGAADQMMATPLPPIPEEVPSLEYLQEVAERRQDDLVFAGGTLRSNPMQTMADTAEAAQLYGELYETSGPVESRAVAVERVPVEEASPYTEMSEQELLNELTTLTGRLRDSLASGGAGDSAIQRQMESLAQQLPAKYRALDLIQAAQTPGERGQNLAQLYLERCYKLFHEDYLDLERLDREIATT